MDLFNHVVLDRTGPADATVGVISLPLPETSGDQLTLDHPVTGMHVVGWRRHRVLPRRAMASVVGQPSLPQTLSLKKTSGRDHLASLTPPAYDKPLGKWTVDSAITREKLDYTPHKFSDIEQLRGVPVHECTAVEFDLGLTYEGKTVRLQLGATDKDGQGFEPWQNVQVDALWSHDAASGVRVGGVIYNGDTYLWADVYLTLYDNGVIDVATHFHVTKLHIDGYDFQGLPAIRFTGENVASDAKSLPAAGDRLACGDVTLNLADAAILCSEEHPATITPIDAGFAYQPFSRTFNPQVEDAPPLLWEKGFARTVRFQMSLSDAAPAIARYVAPAWWYAHCGEPWAGGWLPVRGRMDVLAEGTADEVRKDLVKGKFHGGSGGTANDGDAGVGLLQNYYHTGRAELLTDGLDHCYYWADLAVDHTDFSVHQWIGGWPWKTCAYSKFRDVLYGYLETGDPYLKDTAEFVADSYWQWYRGNWPRSSLGRDNFEVGAWALMWRFFDSQQARERVNEFTHMIRRVLDHRGVVGGQMGAGPHPGWHSSLYMTGVTMCSLLDIAAAQQEMLDPNHEPDLVDIPDMIHRLSERYQNRDIEMFPSSLGQPKWDDKANGIWTTFGCRVYPELARLEGRESETTQAGIERAMRSDVPPMDEWFASGRFTTHLVHPLYCDPMLLGAKWTDAGLSLQPIGDAQDWPAKSTIQTPAGDVTLDVKIEGDTAALTFSAAFDAKVTLTYRDSAGEGTTNGTIKVKSN